MSLSHSAEPLIPLVSLLPDRSPRWIADACRAGRFPGAVKVGRTWSITASAFARVSGAPVPSAPSAPSVVDAAAELRRRGLIAA
jgi:hypothetical protein